MGTDPPRPRPTSRLHDALADADQRGVGILTDVLDADDCAQFRERLRSLAAGSPPLADSPDPNDRNVRVFQLLQRDASFAQLVLHPVALAAAEHLVGPRFILSNLSANICLPGSESMPIHSDQGFALEPWPDAALVMNVIWVIDDFTEEAGATRYVPDSIRVGRNPERQDLETLAVEAPAGSTIFVHGRTWHTSGANRTEVQERAGVLLTYARAYVRPFVDWYRELGPAIETAPDELLELLGIGSGHDELRPVLRRAAAQRLGL